jgi:hypothetical protein
MTMDKQEKSLKALAAYEKMETMNQEEQRAYLSAMDPEVKKELLDLVRQVRGKTVEEVRDALFQQEVANLIDKIRDELPEISEEEVDATIDSMSHMPDFREKEIEALLDSLETPNEDMPVSAGLS